MGQTKDKTTDAPAPGERWIREGNKPDDPAPKTRIKTEAELPIHFQYYFSISDAEDTTIAYASVTPRHGVLWVNLKVEGKYRCQGLGTRLLRRLIEELGDRDLWGIVQAWTDRAFDDTALVAWYKTFGFEETGVPGTLKRPASKRPKTVV